MVFEAILNESVLAVLAGGLLSILFSYIPGLRVKWALLSEEWQKLAMAGLVVVVALVMFGFGCLNFVNTGLECSQPGAVKLIWMIFVSLAANQTVFKLSPQPVDVKSARETRDMG
jgi:hypothetical protein